MTIEAELPDGTILEFPDGTDPAVIQAAVKREIAKRSAPVIRSAEVAPTRFGQPSQQTERRGIVGELDRILEKIPGVPALAELAAGANRSVAGFLDFIGPNNINEILQFAGSETRVPTFSQLTAAPGSFVEGPAGQVLGAAGEVAVPGAAMGAAIRTGAAQLPRLAQSSESAIRGLLRQAGATTPAQDVAFGAISGAGGEFGEQEGVGMLVGSIVAPITAGIGFQGLKRLLGTGANGFIQLTSSLRQLSDEGAASLLAEAMVREGVSPDQVAAQLRQLGPEAIPADVSNTFARLLRTASNEIPRIEGRAATVFGERQAGQTDRLFSALDRAAGVPGLSVDDEIARLNLAFGPEVDNLYAAARANPIGFSPRLRNLLEPPAGQPQNSVSRARVAAERVLADKRAAGDQISNIDIIDATKQVLDDQIAVAIRQGEGGKVRDLVRLKKIMIEEADAAVPEYAQARNLFARKAQLESAADMGGNFLKLKPREIVDITETMGESELRMFRLGAKQAILDKFETLQVGADAVKRAFGRRGDVERLRSLFPDETAFNQFSDTLEREANFIVTRRAAQANSTTARQITDPIKAEEAFNNARAIMGDPVAATSMFGRLLSGFSSKKGSDTFVQSLERAGDILLESGMDPARLEQILRAGSIPRIREALEAVLIKPSEVLLPTAQAATAAQLAQ